MTAPCVPSSPCGACDHCIDVSEVEHLESIESLVEQYVDGSNGEPMVSDSFIPVDLAAVLDGDYEQPSPSVLRRDDGMCLFYAGQINGVHGDSGTGKGWTVLLGVLQQIRAGRTVMLVDAEDVASSIVARLRKLGARDDELRDRLIYIRPTDPFTVWNVDHLVELIGERNVSLVVLDSLGECFSLDGVNENNDHEAGPWLRRVARQLADAGPAVVLVDHSTKSNDNPLHPSGSKRKRAAVGGASYLVTATVDLSADTGGRLRLTCAKDRHGNYRRGEHVADLVMTVDVVTGMQVTLYAPAVRDDGDADLPVVLAAQSAVKAARAEGRPVSRNALIGLMDIRAGTEVKRGGIDLAASRGDLNETAGARGARIYEYAGKAEEEAA